MAKRVFAPASITCFFAPVIGDPLNSGSLGVGITLDKGVFVSASAGKNLRIFLNDREVDFPTVESVAVTLGFKGNIWIDAEVPIGCGFGVSGASALASAFAINNVLGLNKSFFELADLAHKAEVLNRTGLGDVVTQSFGGVVVRKSASSPSKCTVDRFLWNLNLDILVMGGISTAEVLSDYSMDKITEIGKNSLKEFLKNPTVENLFRQSKRFAVETGLIEIDSAIGDAIEAVESSGGLASMVMLGKAVFAVNGDVLKDLGRYYLKAKIDQCGVRTLS